MHPAPGRGHRVQQSLLCEMMRFVTTGCISLKSFCSCSNQTGPTITFTYVSIHVFFVTPLLPYDECCLTGERTSGKQDSRSHSRLLSTLGLQAADHHRPPPQVGHRGESGCDPALELFCRLCLESPREHTGQWTWRCGHRQPVYPGHPHWACEQQVGQSSDNLGWPLSVAPPHPQI